jgi:rod shape-determining protein MreC
MAEFRYRLILAFVVAAVLGAALVNMVVDRRALASGGRDLPWWSGAVLDIAVPIQKMVAVPFDFARDTWGGYVSLVDVKEQNESLRRDLAKVREENLQLEEALVASGRLERIAAMREEFEIPMLPAQLVGVDVSAWFRSALVDRGRTHGVRSGMPVISDDGLVGLVTATSRRAAKVMLLVDRQTALDGVVQRSRARGIVRGAQNDELMFEFVARVSPSDAQMLQTATIRPAVDFGRLEQVFLMLRRGPAMELLYATGSGDQQGDDADERAAP